MTTICFSVIGQPIPQGSMNAFHRGGKTVMVHSKGKALDQWRSAIAIEAKKEIEANKEHFTRIPKGTPIAVHLFFQMPKAKSNKDAMPVTRPDLDKLIRAVLDALTGICFDDDSQVVSLEAHERYFTTMCHPGVEIWVSDDPASL